MSSKSKDVLTPHWRAVYAVLLTVVIYNAVCYYYQAEIQIGMQEEQRVFIRTLLYVLAILLLPLTNLVRFVLVRLNQTMPGDTPPDKRYLVTVLVAQSMIEIIALFGVLMFVLGDGFNTLVIFSVMAVLGGLLHRPKMAEYESIVSELNKNKQ